MDAFEKICCWRAAILEVDTGVLLDSRKLRQQIDDRSNHFSSLGIGHQTRVVISKSSSISFFVDLAATWKQHALAIVVDSNQASPELLTLLNDVRPHFIVNDSGIQSCAIDSAFEISLPNDACLVLYTSGSSAKPKAVIHTATGLAARIDSIHQAIDSNLRTTSFNVLPVHFGHGLIGVCLSALCLDGVLALSPRISIHNAHLVGDWLRVSQASFMSGTPAIWKLIISLNDRPTATLKRVQCASAPTGPSLFRKISRWADAPIWNVYGLTECASWIADYRFERDGDEQIIGSGRAWKTQFHLQHRSEIQLGQSLLLKTDGLFSHYLGRTANQSDISDGWFNTADIGERVHDGQIRLLGRSTRLINRGGIKVAPEEVETALLEHPEVNDVVVFGRSRVGDGRDDDVPLIAALVVGSRNLTTAEMRSFLSQKISDYKIPTLWRFTKTIPKTPNGKIDFTRIDSLWSESDSDS